MEVFRTELELKPQSDISRAQVARFIRRMAVVSEGDVRLVRVLEDADGVGLSVPLPKLSTPEMSDDPTISLAPGSASCG